MPSSYTSSVAAHALPRLCVCADNTTHGSSLFSHAKLARHIHWTLCQNVHNGVRYTPSVVQQPCSRVVVGWSIRSPAVGVCTMRAIGRAGPSSQHVRLLSLLTRDHSSQHASLDRADIIQLSTGSRELDKLLQGDPLPPSCTTHFLAPLLLNAHTNACAFAINTPCWQQHRLPSTHPADNNTVCCTRGPSQAGLRLAASPSCLANFARASHSCATLWPSRAR